MPLIPSDFTLSPELVPRYRALIAAWDARDPWTDNAALERTMTNALGAVTAPRIVMLPAPVHVARFLRQIVEQAERTG